MTTVARDEWMVLHAPTLPAVAPSSGPLSSPPDRWPLLQTPKKLRKEKPPRGHPDRKPRHKNNPRRIPDLFRVARWQQMLYLVHHHHDWLDWKKLTVFLNRTLVLYGRASTAQKTALRESGLLDR